jgi:uncharacterized protein YhaN
MRLRTLHLERYGPFTGPVLSFRPDAKLHVVLGPNEAGKSCALAAITDLLFGIERQTRYDFLHEGKELRIGAEIETAAGKRLAFRRKKNRPVLVDDAENGLAEDVLAPFIGGLSRDVFCRAFGLNSQALRDGAEEMLKSEGEVGASLIAAASGLKGLTGLRKALDAEADAIFAPRAAERRRFYQALARYEEARQAIRQNELRAPDWKSLNERIDTAASRLDEIKETRAANAAEQSRLARLKRTAPAIRTIDDLLARLGGLNSLPAVPAGFAEQLRQTLQDLERCVEASAQAERESERAAQDLAVCVIDERLLVREADIQRLFSEVEAYANNRRDIPRVQAEETEFRSKSGSIVRRLGLPDGHNIEHAQPSDGAMAVVRSLITEGRGLKEEARSHERTLDTEAAGLELMTTERATLPAAVDPAPFSERMAVLAPVLRGLERRAELDRAASAEKRSTEEAAARLDPPVSAIAKFAAASIPSPETVSRFRNALELADRETARERDRLDDAQRAAGESEEIIARLSSGAPIPTPETIAAVRADRDREWSHLRAGLLSSTALETDAIARSITGFERHSAEADRMADAATAEAQRIEAYGAERRRLGTQRKQIDSASRKLSELEGGKSRILEEWHKAWRPAGIDPLSPIEMTAWIGGLSSLLARLDKIRAQQAEVQELDMRADEIAPVLRSLARDAGVEESEPMPVAVLVQRIEQRLRTMAERWIAIRDVDTRMREAESRIVRARKNKTAAENSLEDWGRRWSEAMPKIGLLQACKVEEAEAALTAWQELPAVLAERDNRAKRVSGMQRDAADFEARAAALESETGFDGATLPADLVAKGLNDSLQSMRRADAARSATAKRVAATARASEEAKQTRERAKLAVETLTSKTGIPTDRELPVVIAQLSDREQLEGLLAQERTRMLQQADGHDEARMRAELANFDADKVEAELARLRQNDVNLDREGNEVFATRDREARQRSTLEQGIGAELAVQQRCMAEVELAACTREWIVLKLGTALLGAAVERHRASQQDPLMRRAGELFTVLTGESFCGLAQEYDDEDVARLVGRRRNGRTVAITGLSEGTRDQLYLALRLAYLEDFATRAEPVPFVGDDLFATFDDERTGRGLEALATIAGRVQPIVFTHHSHVARIAEERLGGNVDIIRLDAGLAV